MARLLTQVLPGAADRAGQSVGYLAPSLGFCPSLGGLRASLAGPGPWKPPPTLVCSWKGTWEGVSYVTLLGLQLLEVLCDRAPGRISE